MPKDFTLPNLFRDLEYTIFGTEAHVWLFKIAPLEDGSMVLEPGCGCGKFGLAYALRGCDVILMDIDHEVADYARRVKKALNSLLGFPLAVTVRIGDIHRLHYEDNTFDLVLNEGVPQHWPDEEKRQGAIDQMARVSRDYVIVMGNNGLREEEQKADREVNFGYKGMPPRRKCFTPDELEMRLKKAGLKKVQVEGVTPGPIEDSYLVGGWGRKT